VDEDQGEKDGLTPEQAQELLARIASRLSGKKPNARVCLTWKIDDRGGRK
jgi:hypothetical protein